MSENIKTALYITLALISLSGAVWGASEYLQGYLKKETFDAQCVEWKGQFTELVSEVRLDKFQRRLWWLEQRIAEYDNALGYNCQRCNQQQKVLYFDWKREHQYLQQQIQKIMKYGG